MSPETPLDALTRWEDAGAAWRLAYITATGGAIVELLTCHGEVVDTLASEDPVLLDYLRRRPASSWDEPVG